MSVYWRLYTLKMKYRVASVGEVSEGEGLLVEVRSKVIAIFRFGDELFAVDDTCPHKGGSLHEGKLEGGIVSCPWHDWRFDLRTGICPTNPLSKIETYLVRVEGGAIFVEIE
jgi:nitrite reductase/ring-hydroxylating ferredoxin subunit